MENRPDVIRWHIDSQIFISFHFMSILRFVLIADRRLLGRISQYYCNGPEERREDGTAAPAPGKGESESFIPNLTDTLNVNRDQTWFMCQLFSCLLLRGQSDF